MDCNFIRKDTLAQVFSRENSITNDILKFTKIIEFQA